MKTVEARRDLQQHADVTSSLLTQSRLFTIIAASVLLIGYCDGVGDVINDKTPASSWPP